MQFENRSYFLAICSQLMRQILVEYARGRRAAKREGGYKVTLDEAALPAKTRNVDLVLLDDALNELEKLDLQQEPYRGTEILWRPSPLRRLRRC